MKQLVVGRAPAALVLHVSRSVFDARSGAMTKDRRRVVIPPVLDLAPWMMAEDQRGGVDMRPGGDADARRPSAHTYGLRALVDHRGNHGSGHYVCFRRCAPAPALLPSVAAAAADKGSKEEARRLLFPGWYLCDDESVQATEEFEAVHGTRHGEPFLLYYERLTEEERLLAAAACTAAPESEDGSEDEEEEKEKKEEEVGGLVPVVVQNEVCQAVVEAEMEELREARRRGRRRRA
jgi:ubiquitin carboxyl-terminal hydrolase 1